MESEYPSIQFISCADVGMPGIKTNIVKAVHFIFDYYFS